MFVHIYESDLRISGIMMDQGKCLRRSLFCIFSETPETRGVSHYGLAIYIKKYLKAKEELWKLKILHHAKIWSSKSPLKQTKLLQGIITL
jgi:hypothetical protein